MMCPVKPRNGNDLRAKEPSRRGRAVRVFFLKCDPQEKAANEMTFEINLVFCALLVLPGSSQITGQSSALPPALPSDAGGSAAPHLTQAPGNEVPQWTHNPAGRDETSTQTTTRTKEMVHSETNAAYKTHLLTPTSAVAPSQHMTAPVIMTAHPGAPSPSAALPSQYPLSAAVDGLSSTPSVHSTAPPQHLQTAGGRAPLTRDPPTTFSSQPAHTVQDARSTAHASTSQPQSESLTTGQPLTSATGRAAAGPTHQEVPSELNVGDEDLKGPHYRSSSPLDPLLAGLLSVFIVTTAIVFVILFLRFRQRTNHPEFHRLQDLPMDDLMEDTPLSRYTY